MSRKIVTRSLVASAVVVVLAVGYASFTALADNEGTAGKERPWLGVALGDEDGVVVIREVTHESPADDAGLKRGDVLLELNGKAVKKAEEVVNVVGEQKPGDQIRLKIRRGKDVLEKTAEIGSRPHDFDRYAPAPPHPPRPPRPPQPPHFHWEEKGDFPHVFIMSKARIGIRMQPLTEGLRKYFRVPAEKGVLVSDVIEGSAAENAGVHPGDVIVAVNDKSIERTWDVVEAIGEAREGDHATLKIVRDGSEMTIDVVLEKNKNMDLDFGHGAFCFSYAGPSREEREAIRESLDEARDAMAIVREGYIEEIRDSVRRALEDVRREIRETLRDSVRELHRQVEERFRDEPPPPPSGQVI
ncbi:MAG: PDZ domain-containing protein [Acidobacteriota bacterium]